MNRIKSVVENTVFALNVLGIFLALTERWLAVPLWLQVAGRLHPLLVHFPIAILLLGIALAAFDREHYRTLSQSILLFGALAAAVTVISGFFLSKEGGYDSSTLLFHRWTGIGVSVLSALLYGAISREISGLVFYLLSGTSVVALISAGHLGATLTHGEGYLTGPIAGKASQETLKNDSSLFAKSIGAVMESKCFGCHNSSKAKGDLILTSIESILKGGKHGALWKAGDPGSSLLVQRISLDMEDKKHMPPRDKPQLTSNEQKLIERWIASGANIKITETSLPAGDSLKLLAASVASQYTKKVIAERHYTFAFAPSEKIQSLNTPFRFVSPIASGEPALQADFFVRQAFTKESISQLSEISEQVVSINLSNMPVKDEDLNLLTRFPHLEKLVLNNTDITDNGIVSLDKLPSLASLSLAGTPVTEAALANLGSISSLRNAYLWNTKIPAVAIEAAAERYPLIRWDHGYVPDEKEVLQLSPPLLMNESQLLQPGELVKLKATVPGAIIRYTVDGTEPDSLHSMVYQNPIQVESYTIVKARSYRDGWKSSATASFVFFRKGLEPTKASLLTPGDKKYPGLGITTLVDARKGFMDFFKDPTWIAFRDKPMEAIFHFEGAPRVREITISYAKDVGAETMPPEWVEVYAGSNPDNLKLFLKVVPRQPSEYGVNLNEGLVLPVNSSFGCYKIIAKPLAKLPAFRKAEKDKGWLMVDEIFFN